MAYRSYYFLLLTPSGKDTMVRLPAVLTVELLWTMVDAFTTTLPKEIMQAQYQIVVE